QSLHPYRARRPEAALEQTPRVRLGGDERRVGEEELVHQAEGEELAGEGRPAFAEQKTGTAVAERAKERLKIDLALPEGFDGRARRADRGDLLRVGAFGRRHESDARVGEELVP